MSVGGINFKKWWGKGIPQLMDVDGKETSLDKILNSIQEQIDDLNPSAVSDVVYIGDPTKAGSWRIIKTGTSPNTGLFANAKPLANGVIRPSVRISVHKI